MHLLLIAAAGAVGTLLRYGAMRFVDRIFPGFPWGTLIVNVIGAFLAGLLFVVLRAKLGRYEVYFPIVFVGFLGAFTTFSTFALEASRFLLHGEYAKFFADVALQNGTGLGAAVTGMVLASAFCCR